MSHIYLSYSNQDAELIDLIQADLQERGYVVWRDATNIGRDADWQEAIAAALAGAYTMIVALSQQAVNSESVQGEIAYAQENNLSMVGVQLDGCEVPEALGDTAVTLINCIGVYQAGGQTSGLEQLRQYRQFMTALTDALDQIYPVRVYLQDLSNRNDTVREKAAMQLGLLGDVTATEELTESLSSDQDADVRFAAARSLGQLGSGTAVKALIRTLKQDDDPDVRAAAAVALGHIGNPAAIAPLIEQLDYADRFVRAGALTALGELKATSAVNQIVHLMRNDPISNVRAAAEQALCAIGGTQAERALEKAGVECE